MPIYEYRCNKCKRKFEVMQKISDPPVSSCKYCDSNDVTRLVSLASFSLKGSGWYMTDYSNSKKSSSTASGTSKTKTPPKKDAPAESTAKKDSSKDNPTPAA